MNMLTMAMISVSIPIPILSELLLYLDTYLLTHEPCSESGPPIRLRNYKPFITGTPSSTYTIFINPTLPLSSHPAFGQHVAFTPPRLRENGWVEVQRPDSYVYYVKPTAGIVADVEMRNDRLFHAVSKHLELEQHKDALESAPEGAAELWLRDAGSVEKGFVPVRWWVIHKERQVVFDKVFDGAVTSRVLKKEDRECFASICVDSFFYQGC